MSLFLDYSEGSKKPNEPLAGNPDLLSAVEKVSGEEAAEQRLQLQGVALDEVKKIVTSIKAKHRNTSFNNVLEVYKHIKKSQSGSDPTEEEIKGFTKEIELHGDAIMDIIGDAIIKALEDDASNSNRSFSPQQQRKAVSRVLRLMKQKASFYQLLGVKQSASKADIQKAKKELLIRLHPDKNKDPEAEECAKVIAGAGDALCDEKKRSQHDAFLKNNPPLVDEFAPDEEFAPGAFDDDDSDMEDDEPDSEEDEEDDYPLPSKQVQKQHALIGGKIVKKFFAALDGHIPASKLAQYLSPYNKVIQEDNQKGKLNLDMFTVPAEKLLACQFRQRAIIEYYKGGLTKPERVQEDLQSLQDYFVKTQRRGLYQWPETWTELLMMPLRERLSDLNLPKEQAKTEPAPKNPRQAKFSQPKPAQPKHTQGRLTTEDAEMPDADDDERDHKELRKLAYSLPLRNGGRGGFYSFKLFVEVEGPNPLMVKRSNEVDDDEMLECRRSKDLHNIKTQEHMYRMLSVSDFMGIKGVAWLPETGTDERPCWTYVWVEIRNISDHKPIMCRTALRDWLTKKKADKKIDDFLVAKRIIPPWSPKAKKDPLHSESLALVHPLPKKRKDQVVLRRRDDSDDDDDDDDDDYSLARRTRSRRSTEMTGLAKVMNDLSIAIMDMREEQREMREEQREQRLQFQRLLPAPS
ncbi:hypothetical protein QBC46DRAFT_420939 [Diplogelasinospora grovesii]|uniref:J domain-containing protein n=1 Tax=Diplogelasinospora grovesii TaxID=303347 RepID=A0AAN6NCV8_9PEZI|nr:hypothetical protein QBC46DRAFT_420939 [Diplogelasinospora grovesii]